MQRVVQAEAPDRLDVLQRQGREEQPDIGDVVGDLVLAEDVPLDDARLLGLGDVGHAGGQDRIAVVDPAIPGEEADESLLLCRGEQW